MSEKIEPALIAEAWSHARNDIGMFGVITLEGGNDLEIGAVEWGDSDNLDEEAKARDDQRRYAAVIAALNDGLRDSDPRKITRETVALIRKSADDLRVRIADTTSERFHESFAAQVESLHALADALSSYLPPEK